MNKVLFPVGTRPNLPKVAPILAALAGVEPIEPVLIHTGQHWDRRLSGVFFEELGIPAPAISLAVGRGPRARRNAAIVSAFAEVCRDTAPDAVVVVGDVDSTLACALAASWAGLPLAHVEAGLRSGDRTMPEEINRLLVDRLSDRCYTHCRDAGRNLVAEGVEPGRIRLVGNTMIDTLLRLRPRAEPPAALAAPLPHRGFALVTLHRPALVDDPARLAPMLEALVELSRELPVVFPVHPRTKQRIEALGGAAAAELLLLPPQRYLAFLYLMDHARVVLTDSGGVQEETTALGVPCLTLRDNTERPVTVELGTNRLVGLEPAAALAAAREVLGAPRPAAGAPIPLWDGRAGERIAADLAVWLGS